MFVGGKLIISFKFIYYYYLYPDPPAGVRADPSGGPGPEGDPLAGSWGRGFLGEHPAGRDPDPAEEAGPGSALGGLAPTGRRRLRLRPLTDRKQWSQKGEKKRTSPSFGGRRKKKKGKSFQSKSCVADPPSV